MESNRIDIPTPPAPIWLTHAAIMTTTLPEAIRFYTEILGLSLRVQEADPIREGRQRAMLVDSSGRDTIELIEMPEWQHPNIPGRGGIHHVGFRLPKDEWHALRSRMDRLQYPYQEVQGRLFVRDADALVLEVEYFEGGNDFKEHNHEAH